MFRFFGFHEWSVRFVPALMGAIGTVFIYDIGRRLFGPQIGWCAALVWVSTYAIPEMYRKAMADPYLAFFTLVCVWAWIGATTCSAAKDFAPQSENQLAPRRSSALWLLAFYISFGFALLAIGPPELTTVLLTIR